MAIGQGNKIIASEINDSAATNFSQGIFIYAKDIASLYGGTDNIAEGVLIKAEHFQNLGLPDSGGLNGTFNGVPFKDADNNTSSGFDYVKDDNGWTLYITKGGTINFTNFGKRGSSVDIFMIGGGGAGNKNGGNGGGGQPITKPDISLSTNTSYTLTIGAGATSNGSSGNETYTTIFNDRASGGEGGKAGEKYAETWYAESNTAGDFDYVRDINATSWSNSGITKGNIVIAWPQEDIDLPNIPGTVGWGLAGYLGNDKIYWYKNQVLYADNRKLVNELYKKGSDGSKWIDLTYCFGNSSWRQVGGLGPNPTSASTAGQTGTRYGQGGGGNYNKAYGGSSYGKGVNGLIAIRNHRS